MALLLSGMLGNSRGRSVQSPSLSGDSTQSTYALHHLVVNSTAVHLVDALERSDNATVATFLCIGSHDVLAVDSAMEATIRARLRVAVVHQSDAYGDHTSWGAARDELSWARLSDCFQVALQYERSAAPGPSRRRPFTHFIRGRPDMVWYRDVPPLSASAHMVAVRAWLLHLGGTKELSGYITRDHLVGPHGCMSRLSAAATTRVTAANGSVGARSGARPGTVHPHEHTVQVPCTTLRRPCLIADDQLAIVPREWSLEYFEHCKSTASTGTAVGVGVRVGGGGTSGDGTGEVLPSLHPGLTADIMQELERRSSSPPRWGIDGTPPVEAVYRHWGNAVDCEACMACNSTRHMQNTRCAEPRLTARLLALGVPLGVSAFRQRLLPSFDPGEADPLDSGVRVDRWLMQGEGAFDLWHGYPSHYVWSC